MSEKKTAPVLRTLEDDIPELVPFLKPGMKVLDVGCGPGTITLGVAEVVNPGKVVGIDASPGYIDTARELAAQVEHPVNVTFQVGDSHRLDFPDETFDVVFSHTVLHFFLDPVMALKEQRRVTRKGGYVIASGVRDIGEGSYTYPPSPNWDKVKEAWRHYTEAHLMHYRESGKDPVAFLNEQAKSSADSMVCADSKAGRKCLDWFNKAALSELRIEVRGRVEYQGHRLAPPSGFDMLVVEEPTTDDQRFHAEYIRHFVQGMIAGGLLDEVTLERATEEARAWYQDPGAFRFFPEFFAVGRAV